MAAGVAGADAVDRQHRDDGRGVRTRGAVLRPDAGARAARRRRAARQGARADLPRAQPSTRSPRRSAARRALVRRRRALLARAQRERARTQRRSLDRHRARGQAAGQRRGAEAGRSDRLPPSRAGRLAGEVRRVAQAQPARLRDRLLPGRRAGRAARLASHRGGAARSVATACRAPSSRTRRRSRRSARQTIRRSARPGRSPGASSTSPKGAAIWRPRGSTSPSRTTICRSRPKRGSTPRRWSTTSSSASARRRSSSGSRKALSSP